MNHGVRNLLLKVLDEDIHICCLCLKTVESNRVSFMDQVVISEDSILEMREVLYYVFGETIVNEQADLGSICGMCSSLAANSYKFIKETKQNAELTSQVIKHLDTLFGNTFDQHLGDCKTLYVSLDLDPVISSCQKFDNVDVCSNINKAFQRYQYITNINQTKVNAQIKLGNYVKVKQDGGLCKMISQKSKLNKMDPVKVKTGRKQLKCSTLQSNAPVVFQCPECSESFASLILLQKHIKKAHTKWVCTECGKQFNRPHTLKMHKQGHFSKYICPDCGRIYKNQTTLRLHYENNICQRATRHSPATAKYTCDYCNKRYTQKMTLRVHIQHEHLNYKNYECEWCKKKFWCQSRLKAHVVKHTKEKNFSCEMCNKKFVTKESLLYHTRIHTGEKPYECPQCDSRFLSASRRKAHIRSQHQDANIQCNNCHSKFKSHHFLFKHLSSCFQSSDTLPQTNNQNFQQTLAETKMEKDEFKITPNLKFHENFDFNPNKLCKQEVHDTVPLLSQETVQFVEQERNEMWQHCTENEGNTMYDIDEYNQCEEDVLFHVSEEGQNYIIKVSEHVEI